MSIDEIAKLIEASAEVIDIPPPTGVTKSHDDAQQKWQANKGQRLADVKGAIAANIKVLAKHGLIISKTLGAGSNGIAFELRDGRVLKVTADPTEAKTSFKIQGKKLKHIVNVYGVYRLRYNVAIFAIVQERLVPLDPAEAKEFGTAVRKVESKKGALDLYYGDWEHFLKGYPEFVDDLLTKEDWTKIIQTFEKFNMPEILDDLSIRGIGFHDFHEGNLMKRPNGTYVIADLGMSEPGQGIGNPPVLEVDVKTAPDGLAGVKKAPKPGESMAWDEVIAAHRDLFVKNNIIPTQFLGHGTKGEAYLCRDGRVLKITTDRSEAQTSMAIVGKKVPHVVRIDRVFAFPRSEGFYGILQERLDPLGNEEAREFHVAMRQVARFYDGRLNAFRNGWDEFMRTTAFKLRQSGIVKGDPEFRLLAQAIGVLKKFQIDQMMDALNDIGIKFHDYHEENVMKRGDEYVLIDLGLSDAPNAGDPPVLERRINEGPADQVTVVHGRLQPFTKAQAGFVRKLPGKVVLLLSQGPIPFEDFHDVVKASLPDMHDRVEIYDAGNADIDVAVKHANDRGSKAIRPKVAVQLFCQNPQDGAQKLSGMKIDSIPQQLDSKVEMDRAALKSLSSGDQKAFGQLLDPHLFSDPQNLPRISKVFKKRMEIESVIESIIESLLEKKLDDFGGVEATDRIVRQHLGVLQRNFKFNQQPQLLGNGEDGAVYDIGGNRVMKITAAPKDVASAMKIKGKTLQHVTKVHDVRTIPNTGLDFPIYAVILDKVETLSEEEQDEFNRFWSEVRELGDNKTGEKAKRSDRVLSLLAMGNLDEFFNELREELIYDASTEAMIDLSQDTPAARKAKNRINAAVEQKVRGLWDIMRKYKIPEMVKELSSNGVFYIDYKGDNLGKRNGDYVLLDVGGKSDMQTPPDLDTSQEGVPESVIREAFVSGQPIHAYRAAVRGKELELSHKGGSDYGPGLYFATDKDDTAPFGGHAHIIEADLELKNPIHVNQNEDQSLKDKLYRAFHIGPEHRIDGSWTELIGLVAMFVDMGMGSWPKIMAYFQKLGYDGIYVHSPERAKGDYVAVFSPSQVSNMKDAGRLDMYRDRGGPGVPREALQPDHHGATRSADRDSLGVPWGTGAGRTGSGDGDRLEECVGYILKGVIGDLSGNRD